MHFVKTFQNLFRFRKTTLSFLVFFTYFIIIIIQDISTNIALREPIPEPLILSNAWESLQFISSSKHPFTSHQNDYLHDYLRDTISSIINKIPYISLDDDIDNNHTILINQHDVFNKENDDNRIIYYESSNLLVRINGINDTLPGILISAHYDSVPTSYGTTDDGMGIASMIGILNHFAQSGNQPMRTLIFNFNNNEEFGLLGAEAFINHKWFNDVKFFINLEGTGAGGKPVLFRGTDKSVIDWYNYVNKPFANSIFQEGFDSGFIGSQTDYHVYQLNGLRGIDIAFYLPRSFYHTIKDSIKYTSKGSLWMMMSNVLDILNEVSYSSDSFDDDLNTSLYFDLFNKWFFNFSINWAIVLNISLLVIVPVIMIILQMIIGARKTWFIGARGWCRFPVSIALSYYSTLFILNYLYEKNPLLLSVNYFNPLITIFSITLLISYTILNLSSHLKTVDDQKLIIILEMNTVSWFSMVWMTYHMKSFSNIAGYFITIFYILSSLAAIIGLLKMIFRKSPCHEKRNKITIINSSPNYSDSTTYNDNNNNNEANNNDPEQNPHVHNVQDNSQNQSNSEHQLNGNSSNEETPLMNSGEIIIDHESRDSWLHKLKHNAINSSQYDWLIQFIILVPIPAFFIFTDGKLVLDALHETIQENKLYDEAIWELVGLIAMLLAILLSPFMQKLNFISIQLTIGLFLYGILNSYYEVSYSESNPIKLRYVETFDINTNTSLSNIFGRQGYIPQILNDVPTILNDDIKCLKFNTSETETCSYNGTRPYLVSGTMEDNEFINYLNVSILSNTNVESIDIDSIGSLDKFTPLESTIQIDVFGSRQCYLTFNASNPKFTAPVKMVTIYKEGNSIDENTTSVPNGMSRDDKGNWIYKQMKGINLVELHKLNWQNTNSTNGLNTFTVKLEWLPFLYDSDVELISNLGVNVQCHWSDYDDVVFIDGKSYHRDENYLELMKFTNAGVALTNLRPGVIQGMGYVEI